MKSLVTWHTIRIFIIMYLCVLGINVFITAIFADFDIKEQLSPKSLLFNIIVASLLTLLNITRQRKAESSKA